MRFLTLFLTLAAVVTAVPLMAADAANAVWADAQARRDPAMVHALAEEVFKRDDPVLVEALGLLGRDDMTVDELHSNPLYKRELKLLTGFMRLMNKTGFGKLIITLFLSGPVTSKTAANVVLAYVRTQDLTALMKGAVDSGLLTNVTLMVFTHMEAFKGLVTIIKDLFSSGTVSFKRDVERRDWLTDAGMSVWNWLTSGINPPTEDKDSDKDSAGPTQASPAPTAGATAGPETEPTKAEATSKATTADEKTDTEAVPTTGSEAEASSSDVEADASGSGDIDIPPEASGNVDLSEDASSAVAELPPLEEKIWIGFLKLTDGSKTITDTCISLNLLGLGITVVYQLLTVPKLQKFFVTVANRMVSEQVVLGSDALNAVFDSKLITGTISQLMSNDTYRKQTFDFFVQVVFNFFDIFF